MPLLLLLDSFDDFPPSVGLLSLTPDDGESLAEDPEAARFTPVIGLMQCANGEVPYVFVKIGGFRWLVYSGLQSKTYPMFSDKTTVVSLGSGQFVISVLPNGGWWRSPFEVHFVSGRELI